VNLVPAVSFIGIRSTTPIPSVGEDLVSSHFPRNPILGRSGRYKIDPYTIAVSLNDTVANEMEGTRPSATSKSLPPSVLR
jgi:hypothetical protein